MAILPIGDKGLISNIVKAPKASKGGESPFSKLVDSAQSEQKNADSMLSKMIGGEPVEPHEVMLSLRKAEARFQLVMQVRNKVIDAYQTIMKEQI